MWDPVPGARLALLTCAASRRVCCRRGKRLAKIVTVPVPETSASAEAASLPDQVSRAWIERLSSGGARQEAAVSELYALLLRAARFELGRRFVAFPYLRGGDHDDLAAQSAGDALVAILGKLGDFRGDSRFTTWACKFAVFEAGAKVRRQAWQGREIPLEPGRWPPLADTAATPQQHAEARALLDTLQEGIQSKLTTRQREVLVAIAVNNVPIDVLAERLNTTRGALYKTLHDARQKLRALLAARGLTIEENRGGEAP
jgi:RNA polymerase sigma-70 factor (ECF subfamily)